MRYEYLLNITHTRTVHKEVYTIQLCTVLKGEFIGGKN